MASDTRERMIGTTARLLQHRGYYGTPLSLILEQSGAPRGSLYFHFPDGKDQLVLEATRASVAEATDALRDALAANPDPAAAVRAFLETAADIMQASDYRFGCPVAPVILDATGDLAELADICRDAFEAWVGMLREAFVAGGIPARRAAALALLVDSSVEGLLLIARAWRDVSPIRQVAAELERIVRQAANEA